MYDELTRQDIQKMQEEIDYRVQTLRPKLIEDVQTARAFGDLSENFEYKCAKQEKNRNDSRIRYLQRMIKTARVIEDHSRADTAGLYDTVEILMENTGKTRKIQLVTTLRQDALKGLISKESPVGKAVLGRRSGDRVQVDMGGGRGYWLQILSIEKGSDDGSIPIGSFEKSLAEFAARRRQIKFDSFFAAACTSQKTLLSLQVWNLFAFSEQIMRAADCKPFVQKGRCPFWTVSKETSASGGGPFVITTPQSCG